MPGRWSDPPFATEELPASSSSGLGVHEVSNQSIGVDPVQPGQRGDIAIRPPRIGQVLLLELAEILA